MKFLLFPFSIIYWLVTKVRNYLYDCGFFKSTSFNIPIISIGNLSMGGTGKTPHTAYLIEFLKNNYRVATLSRGYGRKTKGFVIANQSITEREIGDEPMLFYNRYGKEISVAVCEERVFGIKKLSEIKQPSLILLDDAFQHRKVKPHLSILLTEFDALFSEDYLFPMGTLREARKGANRADLIIVTKCSNRLLKKDKDNIRLKLALNNSQKIFFSSIIYSKNVISSERKIEVLELLNKSILLITGIANPKLLKNYILENSKNVTHIKFADHYNFNEKDVANILEKFQAIEGEKIILTTEKDYMRLRSFNAIASYLYYLPIEIKIDNKQEFEEEILNKLAIKLI